MLTLPLRQVHYQESSLHRDEFSKARDGMCQYAISCHWALSDSSCVQVLRKHDPGVVSQEGTERLQSEGSGKHVHS